MGLRLGLDMLNLVIILSHSFLTNDYKNLKPAPQVVGGWEPFKLWTLSIVLKQTTGKNSVLNNTAVL